MPLRLFTAVLLSLTLALSAMPLRAQPPAASAIAATRAASSVAGSGPSDALPINSGDVGGMRDGINARGGAPPAPQRSIGVDLSRMAIALAIVLALILLVRWIFKHVFAGARAPAASRTIKVLGRTSLAPRQQVLLLQVGRRVIVVGESNGTLSTLANLDDADEVAQLLGQLQEEQVSRANAFGGLFGRAQRKFEDDVDAASVEEPSRPSASGDSESEVRTELSGLAEKLRSIRSQLKQ